MQVCCIYQMIHIRRYRTFLIFLHLSYNKNTCVANEKGLKHQGGENSSSKISRPANNYRSIIHKRTRSKSKLRRHYLQGYINTGKFLTSLFVRHKRE